MTRHRFHGDPARFDIVARFIADRFPDARYVADVAGGQGMLTRDGISEWVTLAFSGPANHGLILSHRARGVYREDWVLGRGHNHRVDLGAFVQDGYVAIREAVDADTVAACRERIWAAIERRGIRRDNPGTWPPLVEGMDNLDGEPFAAAYLAPMLTAAYDELIGPGRWQRSVHPADFGETVVVRFPAEDERANAGYHIEGSYRGPDGQDGWVNVRSRARGLLALFLFTDVGRDDAPTRLLCGSHLAVPQFLAPYGEAGTDSDADFWRPSTLCMTAAHATGKAGDVFLCHPFIVHTATWPHRGAGPRMIAQPAVNAPAGFVLDGSDPSPVAQAIVRGLAMAD